MTNAIVHLTETQFIEEAFNHHKQICARVYVSNHKASIVYLFEGNDQILYYLDLYDETRCYDEHAELYQKIALDQSMRNKFC